MHRISSHSIAEFNVNGNNAGFGFTAGYGPNIRLRKIFGRVIAQDVVEPVYLASKRGNSHVETRVFGRYRTCAGRINNENEIDRALAEIRAMA